MRAVSLFLMAILMATVNVSRADTPCQLEVNRADTFSELGAGAKLALTPMTELSLDFFGTTSQRSNVVMTILPLTTEGRLSLMASNNHLVIIKGKSLEEANALLTAKRTTSAWSSPNKMAGPKKIATEEAYVNPIGLCIKLPADGWHVALIADTDGTLLTITQ